MEITFRLGGTDDAGMWTGLYVEDCGQRDKCNAINGMCSNDALAKVSINGWNSNLCRQHLLALAGLIQKAVEVAGQV